MEKEVQQDIIALLKKCEVKKLCDKYFTEDFLWTIKGTSILSGTYTNKEEFFSKVLDRLNNLLLPGWIMHILATYVAEDVFIIEMKGEVKTKAGADYNNEYCWIFKFDNNKLISITAYYDSLLVNKTLTSN